MSNVELSFMEQVLHCRGGGAVQRAHTIRHTGSYSNAEHSWGVAMLMWYFFQSDFKRLAIFALCHDVPECLVGDVPSTAKDSATQDGLEDSINEEFGLPGLNMMGIREHAILKLCDRLELYIWGKEQLALGNQYAMEIVSNLECVFDGEHAFGQKSHWALEPGFVMVQKFYQELRTGSAVPDRTNLLRSIKEKHGY